MHSTARHEKERTDLETRIANERAEMTAVYNKSFAEYDYLLFCFLEPLFVGFVVGQIFLF